MFARSAQDIPTLGPSSRLRVLGLRFGVAALIPGLTFFIWQTMARAIAPDPFPLLLLAVILSAFYGGLAPGLFATLILGGAVFHYYPHHETELALFLALAALSSWLHGPIRAANDELRRQIDFTKAITNNLGQGVCLLDRRGRITYVNRVAEEILGWRRRDLRHQDARIFVRQTRRMKSVDGPEDEPALEALGFDVRRSGDDGVFVRKDGSMLAVSYTAIPVTIRGRPAGVVLSFEDTTDRHQMVEALREGRERYRTLVEAAPDSIVLTDPFGFVLMANQPAAELFGYPDVHDLIGMNIGALFAPRDRQRAMQDRQRAARDGSVRDVEYECLRRDGTTFATEVSVSRILDATGEAVALATFVRDVTKRKEAEVRARARELRLEMQIAPLKVLAEAQSVDEAVWRCLQVLCEVDRWDVGLYWRVDPYQNVLRCSDVWTPPWVSIPEFAHISRDLTFAPQDDLPGTVWSSGEPAWVSNVAATPGYARSFMAAKDQLHGVLCFPVRGENGVYGVIELLSGQVRDERPDVMAAMAGIGDQMGRFIDRKARTGAHEAAAI
ncbi:MAG: PAS domain S-box protein [Chloroflexi bacterium]|nr:PAS domain S-box protein [Chloroflexota bacterium]